MSNPFPDLAPSFGSLAAFRAGSPLNMDGADDRWAWTKENAHSHDLCRGFFKSMTLTVQGQWGNRLPIGSDTTERIPLCWFFVCVFLSASERKRAISDSRHPCPPSLSGAESSTEKALYLT